MNDSFKPTRELTTPPEQGAAVDPGDADLAPAAAASAPLAAAVAPPKAVGTLPAVSYVQGSGVETVATKVAFSGRNLTYALAAAPAGVTIAAVTGVVSISTAEPIAAATVTVRATNAAGAATRSFKVTVAVAPPAAGAPLADVSFEQGSGIRTVAAAPAFRGAELRYALTAAPVGVTIDADSGVVSIPTTTPMTAATVTVRASNPSGAATRSFKVTVAVAPPAAGAPLADVTFEQGSGIRTVAAATAFRGAELSYALTAAPVGVTIDADSGVVSIPTTTPIAATITVRARNAAGNASMSFAVTVREQPGSGDLIQLPTNALKAAIAQPNTAYANSGDGMTTGANSPWSAVAVAYASLAGQSSADDKIRSQLRSWISNKGSVAQGGYSAKRDLNAAAAIALTKLNSSVWNSFTSKERDGLTAIIEAVGVMGAAIESENYGTPSQGLRGKSRPPSNRNGNSNISAAYPALLGALRVFKGSDAATTSFLNGLNCNDLRARLAAAGVTNAAGTFASARPAGAPTLAQIEAACQSWRSFRSPGLGVSDLFGELLIQTIERCANKEAATGWPPTANAQGVSTGVPGSGGRGRMINNNNAATIAAVAGKTGMFHDMHSGDAEGDRCSCSYAIWTGMNPTLYALVGLCAGLVTKSPAMNAAMARLDVGWRTLKIHSDNGFHSWAHDGGTQSGDWTEARMGEQFGWPYAFSFYFDIVKPMYDSL